jgi:hypothetical protein
MPYGTAALADISHIPKACKAMGERAMTVRHGDFTAGGSLDILEQFGKSESAAPQPGTLNSGLALSIEKMPGYSEVRSSDGKKRRHEDLSTDAAIAAATIGRPLVLPSRDALGGHHALPQAKTGRARRLLALTALGSTAIEEAATTGGSAIAPVPQGGLRIATALLCLLGLIALIWGLSAIGQEFANVTPPTHGRPEATAPP